MKKAIFFLASILATINLSSQEKKENDVNQRLAYLCKVWGYVKYFHTEVATGDIEWDDHLLDAIEQTINCNTNQEFNQILLNMIDSAGEMAIPSSPAPNIPDSLKRNLDLTWFQDSIFSDSVKCLLDTINNRFRPQTNYYVRIGPSGKPAFGFDNAYVTSIVLFPEEAIRLLAVFRFWNAINYFYPYKHIMDNDWDSVLLQFIPKVREVNTELEYHLTIKEFSTFINDAHGFMNSPVINNWDGIKFTPYKISHVEGYPVISKVIDTCHDFEVGDVILKIDGLTMSQYEDSLMKYVHCSNEASKYQALYDMISYGDAGEFETVVSNGVTSETITSSRGYFYSQLNSYYGPVFWDTVLEDGCNIGYIYMGVLYPSYVPAVMSTLSNTDAIIFDLRNYPQGTIWTLIDYLYISGITIANFAVSDTEYPGTHFWASPVIGTGSWNAYSKRIIILINEESFSQSEYTCMGLEQHTGAIKIGSQTMGADGDVTYVSLPGFINLYLTGMGVYYPDYTETQRVGIIPDIEVKPTIQGMKNGKDEVLEAALKCSFLESKDYIEYETFSTLIEVFPNPCKDFINYKIVDDIDEEIELQIVDIKGQLLFSECTNEKIGAINISHLKNGVYYIICKTSNNIISSQFAKIQ